MTIELSDGPVRIHTVRVHRWLASSTWTPGIAAMPETAP